MLLGASASNTDVRRYEENKPTRKPSAPRFLAESLHPNQEVGVLVPESRDVDL